MFYFNQHNPITNFEDTIDVFRTFWSLYCEEDGKLMKEQNVLPLFVSLPYPLGYRDPKHNLENVNIFDKGFDKNYFFEILQVNLNTIRRKIAKMNIVINKDGFVCFE